MLDFFRGAIARDRLATHVLTDEAVLHAVNLGAMVHNLLATYEQGIVTSDFLRFRTKLYELSAEFHRPEVTEAREVMRQEWVRRATKEQP